MGEWSGGRSLTEIDLDWKHLVKFVIFQCRLRRRIPSFGDIIHEMGIMKRVFSSGSIDRYNEYLRE